MSELGSVRVIILVYTGQTDLKQIVSQNNKLILFYFHLSVKHVYIVNACSVVAVSYTHLTLPTNREV